MAQRYERVVARELTGWSASMDTSATAANTAATADARPSIRSRVRWLDANTRKITTYTASIAAPAPLIVDTRMLFGDTNGSPYLHAHALVSPGPG
jgi:hypothetical protein